MFTRTERAGSSGQSFGSKSQFRGVLPETRPKTINHVLTTNRKIHRVHVYIVVIIIWLSGLPGGRGRTVPGRSVGRHVTQERAWEGLFGTTSGYLFPYAHTVRLLRLCARGLRGESGMADYFTVRPCV